MKNICSLKRMFDVSVSLPALIVASPIILVSAFAMAATNGFQNSILAQERVGLNNRSFRLYKIKTLFESANDNGSSASGMYTVNRLGVLLRKSRLDELPQFINVLKGNMSLVGPRPLLSRSSNSQNALRYSVLPGITGTAQLRGTKSLTQEELLMHDLEDVRAMSSQTALQILVRDCKIIIKTPVALYKNRQNPHVRSAIALKVE